MITEKFAILSNISLKHMTRLLTMFIQIFKIDYEKYIRWIRELAIEISNNKPVDEVHEAVSRKRLPNVKYTNLWKHQDHLHMNLHWTWVRRQCYFEISKHHGFAMARHCMRRLVSCLTLLRQSGPRTGEMALVPRMPLGPTYLPFGFKKLHFSVWVCLS